MSERLNYQQVVEKLQTTYPNISYDAKLCDDPVCRTVVKAMIEASQGEGWLVIWALEMVVENVSFEECLNVMCGNAINCMKVGLYGWETNDKDDYKNALIAYNRFKQDDDEIMPPILNE